MEMIVTSKSDNDNILENDDYDLVEEFLQQDDSNTSQEIVMELKEAAEQAATQRLQSSTAGVKRYNDAFDWDLMNLSVNTVLRDFGSIAEDACRSESICTAF